MDRQSGKLKIFLGYAAGVGKTFAMLDEANELLRSGVDVVGGYIEPHQRPETTARIQNLEVLTPQTVDYKGVKLYEFDLEAALERNPEVVIVDELAHTNAPGSRHKKRYQDIEELLRNGIDVYTTVNIQHIESLNDVVETITGIVVNERVPDHVFEQADTVELIDIAPHELMTRLHRGKIYKETQAKRALENFFTEDKLVALREIALRKTADQINSAHYKTASYSAKEHILVCLSASPSNEKVIRTAARLSDAFHAQFTAVYVELEDDDDRVDHEVLRRNIRLAEELGAQITTLFGDDVAGQISEYAKVSHVTKIVIGRSIRQRHVFNRTSIIDQLSTYAPQIDVYVIPDTASGYYDKRKRILSKEEFRWKDGLIAGAVIMVATALGYLFADMGFSEANIIIVYLLGVLFISLLTRGRIWSGIASIVSVIVFNFFFTEPQFTLAAYDSGYPFTFLFMFIAALITSTLTTKIKMKDINSVKKTYRTEVLLETSLKFQQATTKEAIISELGQQVSKLVNRNVIVYSKEEGQLVPMVFADASPDYIHDELLNQQEQAIAQWVYANNKRAGAQTNTLSNGKCTYLAIRSVQKVVAVLAIELGDSVLDPFEKNLLVSLINEGGLALEKTELDESQRQSTLVLEQEKLRSNILRTISHDLRTPLTSISGNAKFLIDHETMEPHQRLSIYKDIQEDSLWLIDLVENLLAMTRIDNKNAIIHPEGEVLEDLIRESIQRVSAKTHGRMIQYTASDDIEMVDVDSKLMVQVFMNILDNALKYTPKDAVIAITTESIGNRVRIHFSDTGLGIQDKEHLFDMFYTENQDRQRGMGLGLYLVREIVNAHGGTISVSDVLPHGACFSIELERMMVDESKLTRR
ncbi:sensor histidine kinase KdpD [Erysipelothrix sp. HDW6C]|uniref:sensor histidine kinase n=1 Tax=Erysipelothrix sp. HDW6C TaxID=2714930 RepID=UPI00140B6C1E|nr:sensor histidine kinase KdpD [Erysipelothrix sp. HDW6C]QIK70793.1 sensor histidine kinase KdpD [Erysipelothrix sp. HDW6C]